MSFVTYDKLKHKIYYKCDPNTENLINIDLVPNKFFTYEICLSLGRILSKYNFYCKNLHKFPTIYLTKKFYFKLVTHNAALFPIIPDKYATYNFFYRIIKRNSYAINYMPEKYVIYSMLIKYPFNGSKLFDVLAICKKYYSYKLFSIICKKNSEFFIELPEHIFNSDAKKYKFYLSHAKYIKYIDDVPKKFHTKKLFEKIVKFNGEILGQIPYKYKTKKLCLKAIKSDAESYNSIKEKYYDDYEFNLKVLRTNFYTWIYMDETYFNIDFVLNCIELNCTELNCTEFNVCEKFIQTIFNFIKDYDDLFEQNIDMVDFVYTLYDKYKIDIFAEKYNVSEDVLSEVENKINGQLLLK